MTFLLPPEIKGLTTSVTPPIIFYYQSTNIHVGAKFLLSTELKIMGFALSKHLVWKMYYYHMAIFVKSLMIHCSLRDLSLNVLTRVYIYNLQKVMWCTFFCAVSPKFLYSKRHSFSCFGNTSTWAVSLFCQWKKMIILKVKSKMTKK